LIVGSYQWLGRLVVAYAVGYVRETKIKMLNDAYLGAIRVYKETILVGRSIIIRDIIDHDVVMQAPNLISCPPVKG
jgi:hypothetical protein